MKSLNLALSMVMAMSLAGCGGDSTEPGTLSYVGTYNLAAVNNGALPALYFPNEPGLSITGGATTLRADNSFTETVNYSTFFAASGVTELVTVIENGTYTVADSRLTFTIADKSSWRNGLWYTGTVNGDKLSFTWDGNSYLYRRPP